VTRQTFASLKQLLGLFAEATGLRINYNKSTAVPVHMDNSNTQQCISLLGYKLEGFPKVYLGLPISVHKLPVSAFNSYIDKADRYLAGWQAALLNPMGHAVLVNSVLDSQLVYAMSALFHTGGCAAQDGSPPPVLPME
jgi:hypothetical protein